MKTKKAVSRTSASNTRSRKKALKKTHKQAIKAARPIHKRILLHPVTVFFLMCSVVLVAGLTYQTLADSYTITGKVPAPPLTQGSSITQPSDGATYNVDQVGLNGTCEYKSYTNLYRNGLFVGVAYCAPDGTFHFTADLLEGANTFLAQAYNITDDIGPVTTSITLTYIKPPPPPAPPGGSSNSSGGQSNTGSSGAGSVSNSGPTIPLLLSSDFKYKTFITGNDYTWELNVAGGNPPYSVNVVWGDGQNTNYKSVNGPTFKISHRYKKSGYYAVRVFVTDEDGQTRLIQLAALIHNSGSPDIGASTNLNDGSASDNQGGSGLSSIFNLTSSITNAKEFLMIAGPAVGVVSLMSFSFWLGERQELAQLLAKSMHAVNNTSRGQKSGRRKRR